jgi:integrase
MAARRPVNLTRRQGVYYFRGFIPKAVHSSAQRREVRISLRTHDADIARARLQPVALAFNSLCDQVRLMMQAHAPDQDIFNAVQSFGRALIANASPPPAFAGAYADYDRDRVVSCLSTELLTLETAIASGNLAPDPIDEDVLPYPMETPLKETHRYARRIVADHFPAGVSPERFNLLCAGIARAQFEERKHFRRRLEDPFAPLNISDPLFATTPPVTSSGAEAGPTFEHAVAIYMKAKAGVVWTKRTQEENRRILRLASEHFGPDTPITAITLDNARALRDSVIAWRKKPSPTASLLDISDAPASSRISAKSAAKYFGYVSAAFAHWTNEGYLEKSPVGKLAIHIPHQTQASARTPFAPSELNALFSSPLFTGCAGPQRRTKPGQSVIRDGLYWALLIAPLSGLRITEIVQLALNDIDFSDEVPAFRIKADVTLGQAVKSDAGWRRVPVHRRLIELGFKDFVTARQTASKSGRLLHDIHISNTGGSGGELSKLFGRILHRLELKRPGLVFHSFRHGFVDALREVNAPEYVIRRIVGHASGNVTDGYGSGASLKTCRDWIDKITLLDKLPPPSTD